jgi:hypothetical protein
MIITLFSCVDVELGNGVELGLFVALEKMAIIF